jgi:hypothetical protein
MHKPVNPPGDLPNDDDAVARRLSDALRFEADRVTPPPDAWQTHQAWRHGPGGALAPTAGAAATRGRGSHWRIPLIAAAAVVAVAITTAVIVTHESGLSVSGSPGGIAGNCGTDVPASAAIMSVDTSNSEPVATTANIASDSSPALGATASANAPDVTVRMFFAHGTPPKADLCGVFGGMSTGTGSHPSDGTPLGYLSIFGAASDSARYVWGAVGPDVMQLQVSAAVPQSSAAIDPGFRSGPMWVIDSGHGTPWSLPEAATTAWTDLGNGWHGFAMQIPGNAAEVDAIALGRTGAAAQNRILELSTGKSTDGPLAQPTDTIASAPTTRPTSGAGSTPITATTTVAATIGTLSERATHQVNHPVHQAPNTATTTAGSTTTSN